MSISSSLQQVAGGVASVIAGMIVVEAPNGELLHFDILGYVLVCTTLVSVVFMYVVGRKIGGERDGETGRPEPAHAAEAIAVSE